MTKQAVFASHRLVWSKIAKSGRLGVVMEDDLVFDDKIGQVLSAISQVKEKFDILRLNTSMQKCLFGPEILLSQSLSVRPIFEPMADSGCYALTADAAQNLLRMSASFCAHLDDFLFSPERRMSCLQLCPPRASQIIHIDEISRAW
ncbi:glycosyltransferase family 25 protein [Amylibacter sp.]|nr:glycosyltransferase family 25 protein [Amylibacter sp.]